jgi:hypothetical protein
MSTPPSGNGRPRLPLAMKIGFGLWVAAALWWLGATGETSFFQRHIKEASLFWLAGAVALLIGLLGRRGAQR